MLTKRKLEDLLHEIDPTETMDDDVEEVLLNIADDFIENVISASCQLAKHRKSNTLDVKDVQLHLGKFMMFLLFLLLLLMLLLLLLLMFLPFSS